MAAVIELFYDVISPYSYYAASILQRYSKYDPTLTVKWRPFFLGFPFFSFSITPPLERVFSRIFSSREKISSQETRKQLISSSEN